MWSVETPGEKHLMLLPRANYAFGTDSRRTPSRMSTHAMDSLPLAEDLAASLAAPLRTRREGAAFAERDDFRYS